MASGGVDVDPMTGFNNRISAIQSLSEGSKVAISMPEFRYRSLGHSQTPAFISYTKFLGRDFSSRSCGSKGTAKHDLASKLSEFIDGLGGLEGVTSTSSSHLTPSSLMVMVGDGKKWWEVAKDNKKKKNRKGKGAMKKSRETLLLKLKKYGDFVTMLVRCKCGVLNMKKHSHCSACSLNLEDEGRKIVVIFLDLERCAGNLMSTPTSVGLVARVGETEVEKEMFVMIDEDGGWKLPRRNDYIVRNISGLYYEGSGERRKMMKRDNNGDKVLSAVSEEAAVSEFMSFLSMYKASVLVFHGQDDQTLKPWLQKFGRWEELVNMVVMVDSQGFFRLLDEQVGKVPKVNLPLMVKTYGDEEVQDRYKEGKHSAVTDAWALERLVTGDGLRDKWADWLDQEVKE